LTAGSSVLSASTIKLRRTIYFMGVSCSVSISLAALVSGRLPFEQNASEASTAKSHSGNFA
jgi:hypothetical protein